MRQPVNYAHNKQLSTVITDIISLVQTGVVANPSKLSFYNSSSTSARIVTVYVIESGGSADTGTILASKTIAPGKTWNVIEIQGESIEAGMKVQAGQSAGTDINANCSGSDFT